MLVAEHVYIPLFPLITTDAVTIDTLPTPVAISLVVTRLLSTSLPSTSSHTIYGAG